MNFFKDFKDSFKPKYKKRKLKDAIKYLSILILIFSLIFVGQFWWSIKDFRIDNFPEVSVIDGEVQFNKSQPYVVSEDIIIDTTNKTNIDDYEEIILIKKTEIVSKNGYETRSFDLSEIEEFHVNKSLSYKFLIAFGILVSFLIIFFIFLGMGLYTLFASVIALLIASMMNKKMSYERLWIICAYALTPVLVIGLILNIAGIQFLFRNTIIYIVYLILIIKD